jgi:Asp-tRNA(Asn)/Glu-tRNA(Gln) amidotransferase A subunit family amidase
MHGGIRRQNQHSAGVTQTNESDSVFPKQHKAQSGTEGPETAATTTIAIFMSPSDLFFAISGFIDGLPVGMQLMGPHHSERTLLRAAHAYEQSTDWHDRHPSL